MLSVVAFNKGFLNCSVLEKGVLGAKWLPTYPLPQ